MLNRAKVIRELERVSDRLFYDFFSESGLAREVWAKIANDPTFAYNVRNTNSPWPLPSWQGRLDDLFLVDQKFSPYRVLAVDGSQIYPDKHQGTTCSLINIGSVQLSYGLSEKNVYLNSEPLVFVGDEDSKLNESPQELVNCRRQEYEFHAGLSHACAIKKEDAPFVFLFDGSLIFWHLEAKDRDVKNHFLASYLDSLQQFYEQQILIAGYISLTKSKELVNLIRIALAEFADHFGFGIVTNETIEAVGRMSDAHVVQFFLHPSERTTVFKNHSSITKHYPQELHPHFFYLHVGSEVVRVEIPAWIALEERYVAEIARIILDQARKGGGYPVALAEAHEQAVVKGPDRDFFYHLVKKIGMEQKCRQVMSQKVRKKRGMRI